MTRRKENKRRVVLSVTGKEGLMNAGDRVSITDASMTHTGTITVSDGSGMCFVKWDSGITEYLHENELGRPETEAYPPDDPKSEGYADRMADIWDQREKG